MTSLSLLSTNYKIDNESELEKKNDILYNNSISSFKAFDSALFISEFQGYEDNISLSLEKSNERNKLRPSSNSNIEKNIKNIPDIKFSPSLEKCLTNELLYSITNDSNNIKKGQKLNFNNNDIYDKYSNEKIIKTINNNESKQFLKITKKLFNHEETQNQLKKSNSKIINEKNLKKLNEKKGNTLYEETINGFEYQLKFIENSVHNILPKSYKKFPNNSNKNDDFNNNKDNPRISSNVFSNKYNNKNNYYNNDYSKKNISSLRDNNYNLDYKMRKRTNIFDNDSYNNKENHHHQVHKLKITYNTYGNWICNECYCLNRGYRKVCANCSNYRNLN